MRPPCLRRSVLGPVGILVTAGATLLGCWESPSFSAPAGTAGNAREPPVADVPIEDAIEVRWSFVVEVAAGDAYQGPWRMNESEFLYVDDPTVAFAGDGAVGVAWVDQARKDVFFQLFDADGEARLAEPVNVSRSPRTFSWLPRVAIAAGAPRQVSVLWQEIVFSGGSHGGEIFFSRSTDGGRTFSRPRNLSNTPAGAGKGRLDRRRWHNGSLDLARGHEGELYAAWTEYEGTLWLRSSTDGGESFSELVAIAGEAAAADASASPARGPTLAVGPESTVYLAWTVGEDPAADIRLARSHDGGRTFATPRIVFERHGHGDAPKLAIDSEGTLHLVWAESAEGTLGRYLILHTRSADGGRSFEEPREISGAHAEGFDSVAFPDLALDGAGDLYVLWHIFPDHRQRPRGLGWTVSRDGGRTFAPPAVVPGTAEPELGITGSLQGLLVSKLAVDEAGSIAVVNSSFQPNQGSQVRLIRGR